MTTIDKSGQSIEEIIRDFRREHNIRDHELRYEVLKKPSKGFLGLFANKTALIRFQVPETPDRAKLFAETLLKKMGVSFANISAKMEGKSLYLTIEGVAETGFLIGKNGSMLETIQYLINRVFEDDRKLERIYLDADGYRERREAQFLQRFLPLISKIKTHGKALTLDPMSPGERRIIHRHIERDKGLRTLTIGEGDRKRIVIFSSKQKESEALQQAKQGNSESTATPETAPKNPKPRPKPNNRAPRGERPAPEKTATAKPIPNENADSDAKPERKPRSPRKPRNDYRPRRPQKNNDPEA